MKKLKFICLLLSLFLWQGISFSQASGEGVIRFFVDVDNGYFEIEINDTMLLKRYKDTLPVGNYKAKIWSPGYVEKRIDFTIVEGKTVEKHITMVKNNDFIDYEVKYKAYRMQFHKQLTLPLSVTLLSSLTSSIFMVKAYDLKRKIRKDIDLYSKSSVTNEIRDIKSRIALNNSKYNRQRTFFYVNTGFTFAFLGATILSYRHFKKNNTEPVYNKQSPFDNKYSINLTPYGCSFTINI